MGCHLWELAQFGTQLSDLAAAVLFYFWFWTLIWLDVLFLLSFF